MIEETSQIIEQENKIKHKEVKFAIPKLKLSDIVKGVVLVDRLNRKELVNNRVYRYEEGDCWGHFETLERRDWEPETICKKTYDGYLEGGYIWGVRVKDVVAYKKNKKSDAIYFCFFSEQLEKAGL